MEKVRRKSKKKVYEIWKDYEEFIRSLHLKSVEDQEKDNKERVINYIKKLVVIFIASFFTTLTFQFFITPNKLFNSGINGIIQVLTAYYFASNNISNYNYPIVYYSAVFFVNFLIVSILHFFYPDNLEMNSTAIFYVVFQFIWSNVFKYSGIQDYIFVRFAPSTWSNLTVRNQLGLTLPFYITIGVVSSIIHTFGYSLIYQAKSTPGGLDIVSATLSQNEKGVKKSKISIGQLTKMFGIAVVFLVTIFNFVFVEDNETLNKNELISYINHAIENKKIEGEELVKGQRELDDFLSEWIASNDHNWERKVLNLLKEWTCDIYLEDNKEWIKSYLSGKKSILERYREKIELINENGLDSDFKKVSYYERKMKDLEINTYEKTFFGYLKYITNDEKLWASLVYIFLSSYLINQIFPKNKLVNLVALVSNEDDLDQMLELLGDYNPVYSKAVSNNKGSDNECFLLSCLITKWNYQLLSNELIQLGKVSINAVDESN